MLCRYERTIFKSDKGFCIFSYSTEDQSVPKEAHNRSFYHDDKIHFTAIGYHLVASNAVEVELDGTWENSKHGLQLSVSMCKEIVPTNQAGILAYLSSGVIKGVGPEIAKAIVARFGDKTMEVLDKEPQKLLSIKGIAQRYESRGNLAAGKRTADQIILLKDYDPEIIRNFVERVRVYPSGEIEIDMRTSSGFEFVTAS